MDEKKEERLAYVYQHRRLDTYEVFYVGIGTLVNLKRAYNKSTRSNFWKSVENKVKYKVEIVSKNLTREEAIRKEMQLIALYGRRDLGTGSLVNMTSGGEGYFNISEKAKNLITLRQIGEGNSFYGKKHTEETIKLMSFCKTGENHSMYGKFHLEEAKEKMRLKKLGKKVSEETKRRQSKTMQNKITKKCKPILNLQTGIYYNSISEAARAYNINDETLRVRIIKGKTDFIYI